MNRRSHSAQPGRGIRLALLCLLAGVAYAASARDLHVQVTDADGHALANAVVMADWSGAPTPDRHPPKRQMRQHHRHFVPHVLVVPQYTPVAFPNLDKTRHHVYSFSRAKTFDIKLYHGRPKRPIVFDKAGVVTLGCNIHDQMRGYIVVTAAPRWALTDKTGQATLADLPDAPAALSLWHPWMASEDARVEKTAPPRAHRLHIAMPVSAPPAPQHAKSNLQNLFNRLAR